MPAKQEGNTSTIELAEKAKIVYLSRSTTVELFLLPFFLLLLLKKGVEKEFKRRSALESVRGWSGPTVDGWIWELCAFLDFMVLGKLPLSCFLLPFFIFSS